MNKLIIASVLFSGLTFAAHAKNECGKKHTSISCEGIEGAKRESFCWKGKLSDKRKVKICSKAKKNKKAKKKS